MAAGRPRTVSPEPEECIKLGKEFLEWAAKEDPENPRFRFAQWYSIEKMMPRKKWKTLIQSDQFLPYYESAQAYLAKRCMDPKVIDKSFGHRYIRMFDRDVVESENEEVAFKAEMAKKEEKSEQTQKIVFEVNYKNDSNPKIEVLPKTLPTPDSTSAE